MNPFSLPLMMAELTAASAETIWHRTALMLTGECTHREYERMVSEKLHATSLATTALLTGETAEEILRPFHRHATANARRLRR
ncbi:MAG TPA: hypothetical protein VMB71_15090 [Acetobacteraceae bacterium]|nr:hypothetical protein [Acetobacteraceae bacterium]